MKITRMKIVCEKVTRFVYAFATVLALIAVSLPAAQPAQANVGILRQGDSGNQAGSVSDIAMTYSYAYDQTVTAVRTAEGTLKLIGWQVNNNGSVTRHRR